VRHRTAIGRGLGGFVVHPSRLRSAVVGRVTLMDRRGEGVAILLERGEKLSGRRPVYALIDDSELELTIFAASALERGEG